MNGAAESIAHAFHEAYERLAPECGYETREATRDEWAQLEPANKLLMVTVVTELLERGVIRVGEPEPVPPPHD